MGKNTIKHSKNPKTEKKSRKSSVKNPKNNPKRKNTTAKLREMELKREENRKDKIYDSIVMAIRDNEEYLILCSHQFSILMIKKVSFNVLHTANAQGFQPLERTEECKKWVTFIVSVGRKYEELGGKCLDFHSYENSLLMADVIEIGVPEIIIRSEDEIQRKLNEI